MSWLGLLAATWLSLVPHDSVQWGSLLSSVVRRTPPEGSLILPWLQPIVWTERRSGPILAGFGEFEPVVVLRPVSSVVFSAAMSVPRTVMRGLRIAGRDRYVVGSKVRVRLRPWVSRGGVRLHVRF